MPHKSPNLILLFSLSKTAFICISELHEESQPKVTIVFAFDNNNQNDIFGTCNYFSKKNQHEIIINFLLGTSGRMHSNNLLPGSASQMITQFFIRKIL